MKKFDGSGNRTRAGGLLRHSDAKEYPPTYPGPDGLTANLYKLNIDFFAPLLTELFNIISETELYPQSFKIRP